ncbi:hypothetical protein [Streptomyces sp. WAC05858]|nr:hypothetical protein [Streptomyces sp. WAC05858]
MQTTLRHRPAIPVRGRRQVVNGILWKLSTGAAWRYLRVGEMGVRMMAEA